jgi:hypothetical protein
MANYPNALSTFTPVVDGTDVVQAYQVNNAYTEITAITTELGINPSDRSTGWSTTFDSTSTTFSTVQVRIDNVENGAKKANDLLVSNVGGTTITPSGTGVIGLVLKGVTSGTANLLEARASGSSTPVTYIAADGSFYTPTIDGGSAA